MISRACLALALVCAASAVVNFNNNKGFIVTNKDIKADGTFTLDGLDTGSDYYVYGVNAVANPTQSIKISRGNDNFDLKDMHTSADNGGGELNAYKYSKNDQTSLQFAIQGDDKKNDKPFTVYVTTDNGRAVFSAAYVNGKTVQKKGGTLNAGAMVLSAEPSFTLSNFQIGKSAVLDVHTAPKEVIDTGDYEIFTVSNKEYAPRSFVIISSPVATVNIDKWDTGVTVSFNIDIKADYKRSFTSGSVFSVASPAFMKKGVTFNNYQYDYDRSQDFFNQTYSCSNDSKLKLNGQGNVNKDNGDYVQVTLGPSNPQISKFTEDFGDPKKDSYKGNNVNVQVQAKNPKSGPTFYITVTSGASLLNSLSALAVAACLTLLH